VADGGAEQVRVLEGQLDRPVAAHGQPGDHAALARRDGLEGAVHEADDVPDDVGLEGGFGPVFRIGIEAALAVGHDDDQRQAAHIPLDARPPGPGGVVVGQAVQQVENGERPGLAFRHDRREGDHLF